MAVIKTTAELLAQYILLRSNLISRKKSG